ncbi:MAG TPA: leucyl aminopeptidase [Solirubrobacteraceae bacterium]|jgi:leucyl aminopeptidase|nr:leucyl aminopeptidase [Solirubrobacteraceae bacterium]
MNVSATTDPAAAADADTVAVGLFEGEKAPDGLPTEAAGLVSRGEARATLKALAVAHDGERRWLLVGLGKRRELTAERARAAAAGTHTRALELTTKTLCWQAPGDNLAVCAALVEGTVLADYRFDRHKSAPGEETKGTAPKHLQALIVSGSGLDAQDLERTVAEAAIVSAAVNAARDLQNRPANDLTPTALAEHARALALQIDGLTVETEGREEIVGRGMGAFAAVAQGSEQEPALIVLRYAHPQAKGPLLGLVGKAVTFDSGGISLKPGAKMAEMKFDMSGGAAVVEALAAIARLRLPVKLVGVVGATENLPSGRSVKPGDIVTAANGKTIEVNNTDAEGRLVLADCLHHAVSLGAERVIDLATLTGAVIIALGSTYAGLIGNDDDLAQRIAAAGERTGEIVWRLPLHEEYDELIKGTYGDLDNAPEGRKAGTIVGGAFLSNFVGDTPWAHLDIAGSAWDLGRAYVGKGASGYGVRLLVELARSYA